MSGDDKRREGTFLPWESEGIPRSSSQVVKSPIKYLSSLCLVDFPQQTGREKAFLCNFFCVSFPSEEQIWKYKACHQEWMCIQALSNNHSSQVTERVQIVEVCCLKRVTFSNKIASNPPLNQLLISVLTNTEKISQINQATEWYSQAGKMLLLNYVLPNSVQSCSLWAKWTRISMENDLGSFSPWAYCRAVHWKMYCWENTTKRVPRNTHFNALLNAL